MTDIDNRWSSKQGYVAYTRAVSIDSIAELAAILDTEEGIAPLVLPEFKEPLYDEAHKLEAIANWLKLVVYNRYPQYQKAAEAKAKADEKAKVKAVETTEAQREENAHLLTLNMDELLAYASDMRIAFPPNTLPDVIIAEIIATRQREAAAKLAEVQAAKVAIANEQAEDEADDLAIAQDAEHDSAYNGMTKKELKALADDRGVNIDGLRSNADIIDALEAADTKGE